jgi:hypothetical protein
LTLEQAIRRIVQIDAEDRRQPGVDITQDRLGNPPKALSQIVQRDRHQFVQTNESIDP